MSSIDNKGFLLEKEGITVKKTIRTIIKIYFMNSKLTDRCIIDDLNLCNILVEKFDFSSNLKKMKVEDLGENVVKTNLYNIEESLDIKSIHTIDLDEYDYFKPYNGIDSPKNKYYYSFEKEVEKDRNSNDIYKILYELIDTEFRKRFKESIEEINEATHSEKLKKWFES